MIHHSRWIAHKVTVFPWLALTALLCQSYRSSGFHMPTMPIHRITSSSSSLGAFSLTSALESCVPDDIADVIQWIEMTEHSEEDDTLTENASEDCRTMPLYPLSACYLPTGHQHQLRNTEPRNLKMALDLGVGGRFCVVFSALDTGRMASIGTVFHIRNMDPHHDPASGTLTRIVLTCQAEELVQIRNIHNPEVAQWEQRLKRSSEYLMATVCARPELKMNDSERVQEISNGMLEDYTVVSQLYKQGIGAEDLPPFSRERLEDVLPTSRDGSSIDAAAFWHMAQDWQTLCYTVREGHQIALMSDQNELLIDAAMRQGGPLNLPVHVEDLLLEDRQKVQDLEVQGQHQWLSQQLDPSIDFQALLSFRTYDERLEYFASMIRRERKRLEGLLLQTDCRNENKDKLAKNTPIKGAWFDDSAWS